MNNIINVEDLEKIMEKYKTEKSIISIDVKDFDGNVIVQYNPNIKVNSASVIKVAIMIAVLKKVEKNELSLNKIIEFEDFMKLEDYDGIYDEIEKKASILELLTFMIINSDNMATDVLIDLYGFSYIMTFLKKLA